MFTADLHFSELCGVHRSVTLSRVHSLYQMNVGDFVKLKSSVKNISYPFIQAEYHAFLPSIFSLLILCFFSKNKKTIIVPERQKYQPRNTKGFIANKEPHRLNFTGWVVTFKITLTHLLVAYKYETNKTLHSSSLIKQDFDSY